MANLVLMKRMLIGAVGFTALTAGFPVGLYYVNVRPRESSDVDENWMAAIEAHA